MEDNKVETDAGKVSFIVDCSLINEHLLAVSKDRTRIALTCVRFEHKDGNLHIISCDGRMLFHTTIPDDVAGVAGEGEWSFMVNIPAKLKANKRSPSYIVEADGDVVSFTNYVAGENRLFHKVKDATYPSTVQVETFDKREPTGYKPFEPRILSAVYEYVGVAAYSHPVCRDCADEAPYQFTCTGNDGLVKRATIMPIRG